jgi:hypothetical protein
VFLVILAPPHSALAEAPEIANSQKVEALELELISFARVLSFLEKVRVVIVVGVAPGVLAANQD